MLHGQVGCGPSKSLKPQAPQYFKCCRFQTASHLLLPAGRPPQRHPLGQIWAGSHRCGGQSQAGPPCANKAATHAWHSARHNSNQWHHECLAPKPSTLSASKVFNPCLRSLGLWALPTVAVTLLLRPTLAVSCEAMHPQHCTAHAWLLLGSSGPRLQPLGSMP